MAELGLGDEAIAPVRAEDAIARSRQIAGFLGPTVIAIAASEAKNLAIWETGNAALTYQAGLLWFLGGLAVVRLHDRWTTGWPVAITLVGWFFLLGGVFRLLFPEAQQGNQNTPAIGVYALDAVLFAFGVLMTFKAFRPPPQADGAAGVPSGATGGISAAPSSEDTRPSTSSR